jgi:hypothetical protein
MQGGRARRLSKSSHALFNSCTQNFVDNVFQPEIDFPAPETIADEAQSKAGMLYRLMNQ